MLKWTMHAESTSWNVTRRRRVSSERGIYDLAVRGGDGATVRGSSPRVRGSGPTVRSEGPRRPTVRSVRDGSVSPSAHRTVGLDLRTLAPSHPRTASRPPYVYR